MAAHGTKAVQHNDDLQFRLAPQRVRQRPDDASLVLCRAQVQRYEGNAPFGLPDALLST